MSDFERVVRDRLKRLNTNAFAVEKSSPIPEGTLRNVLRGTDVRLSTAKAICDALGLEFYVGPLRDQDEPMAAAHVDDRIAFHRDYAEIKRLDVEVSAGNGAEAGSENELSPVAFRRDWLLAHGVRPAKARIVRARGESMEPTIQHGDDVLVDTSRTEPPPRDEMGLRHLTRVWVVRLASELFVKRLDWRPAHPAMILISDNVAYGGEVVMGAQLEQLQIVGEAVWWSHTARP